jgi:hypothetical protein
VSALASFLGVWSAARLRLAGLAITSSLATGVLISILAGSGLWSLGAGVYLAATGLGLLVPAGIAAQVVAAQVLVASLLLRADGPSVLLLAPAVAGAIVTAELLTSVARLDMPIGREASEALPGAGFAAALGGAVFVTVVLAGAASGPGGLLAVALASGACVVLAARLAGATHA